MTDVRLFAALRAAAGTAHVASDARDVPTLLAELRERFGEPFASRLAVATVVLDGEPVAPEADRSLAGVREVVLLPPFSGG